ncbi:hypothetical protein AMTR_s00099p00041990 [Amborella trichopoda]|uniref:Uncharacterized protein n=1 Tax=Amborella trichopoda TaxID=13333 RepID=W1NYD2_AMBTC|nr:hypothetical protein AMTR_s00099p00041990 [Amborella trichopoda]
MKWRCAVLCLVSNTREAATGRSVQPSPRRGQSRLKPSAIPYIRRVLPVGPQPNEPNRYPLRTSCSLSQNRQTPHSVQNPPPATGEIPHPYSFLLAIASDFAGPANNNRTATAQPRRGSARTAWESG